MHRQRRQPRRSGNEQEHQQPVVRTAALRDRHDGQPVEADLRRHVRAGQRLRHRRQAVDEQRPAGCPPAGTCAASTNIAASEKRSTSRACAATVLRGRPRKLTPNAFTKHAAASAADNASSAPSAGMAIFSPHCGRFGCSRMAWKVSHSETKPFSGGSAEIAAQPTRKQNAVLRHAVDQAAEMLHVALAGRGQHRAGAEEQQALEHRVVEDVEQRRGQRQRRGGVQAVGDERQRQAEADEDDADVLHRVVGEQALQVMLHQRVEHAEHGGDAAQHQHDHAGPPARHAQQVEHDADEAVDRDLGHHAAHQRGDVAGRGGMRERQPDMQRHDAGFRSGADQRQDQHQCCDPGRRMRGAHGVERVAAGGGRPAGRTPAAGQNRRRPPSAGRSWRRGRCRCSRWCASTSAQDASDISSQANRKMKASSAMTTSVRPARNSGIEGQHALRLGLVAAVAEGEQAGARRCRARPPPGRSADSASSRTWPPVQGRPTGSTSREAARGDGRGAGGQQDQRDQQ